MRVSTIAELLGLTACQFSPVGDASLRGISGGQVRGMEYRRHPYSSSSPHCACCAGFALSDPSPFSASCCALPCS